MPGDMSELQPAIDLLRNGDKAGARRLLLPYVHKYGNDPQGWLWLAGALEDPAQKRFALEWVLQLEPGNQMAPRGIEQVRRSVAPNVLPEPHNPLDTPEARSALSLAGISLTPADPPQPVAPPPQSAPPATPTVDSVVIDRWLALLKKDTAKFKGPSGYRERLLNTPTSLPFILKEIDKTTSLEHAREPEYRDELISRLRAEPADPAQIIVVDPPDPGLSVPPPVAPTTGSSRRLITWRPSLARLRSHRFTRFERGLLLTLLALVVLALALVLLMRVYSGQNTSNSVVPATTAQPTLAAPMPNEQTDPTSDEPDTTTTDAPAATSAPFDLAGTLSPDNASSTAAPTSTPASTAEPTITPTRAPRPTGPTATPPPAGNGEVVPGGDQLVVPPELQSTPQGEVIPGG